jgi:hypothetical protein
MADYNYKGTEIISELILNPEGGLNGGNQKILVKCSKCSNIKNVGYLGHVTNMVNKNKSEYKCSKCINGERIKEYNKSNTGVSLIDRLGEDTALKSIEKRKITLKEKESRGIKIPRPGNTKTWDERFGIEESIKRKEWMSKNNKLVPKYGPDNPQWGKPAHKLSGKGTKGYYNGIFFRSLMELSFIINFLEKNNIIYESGELKKYAIPYKLDDISRNYFCDFVVDKTFYEIKPEALHNTYKNRCKWEYAKTWCSERGYEFKVYSEYDFDLLKREEIDKLITDDKLILL